MNYIAHYSERTDVLFAAPNFYIRAAGPVPVQINDDFVEKAATLLGCLPRDEGCGAGVRIALIDSGVDPKVLSYRNSLMPEQYDTDAPRDLTAGLSPYDECGHGSIVAYIVNYVAPAAEILSLKIMKTEGDGTFAGLIAAIFLAEAKFKPDIYNLSISVTCDLTQCRACGGIVGAAATTKQLQHFFGLIDRRVWGYVGYATPLIIAAAGNDSGEILLPASLPDVLAVGCSELLQRDQAVYQVYKNVSPGRFIMAPGGLKDKEKRVASKPGWDGPKPVYGTSFAAPFVTGVAARYLCATKDLPCMPSYRDRIARRAYQLWIESGKPHGTDVETWLEAEREVGWPQCRPRRPGQFAGRSRICDGLPCRLGKYRGVYLRAKDPRPRDCPVRSFASHRRTFT